MNYYFSEFTSRRCLPKRSLRLPLVQIDGPAISAIINGKCLLSNNKEGVLQVNEQDFHVDLHYSTPSRFYSAHGFTDSNFLLTDNDGNVYVYQNGTPSEVSNLPKANLYFLKGETHWIDECRSLHMYATEGIKRNRISGEKFICLFDWNKREFVWKVKPEVNVFGYAIGQSKLVYQAGLDNGTVYCLDLYTGDTSWIKTPQELIEYADEEKENYEHWQKAISGNPRIYKNIIIVGLPFFRIIGIDIKTGEKVWEYKLASDEYSEQLANIESRPYQMAVTESGSVYRIELADVVCGYDKHCHRLFLVELDAVTGNLIQRLEILAPEGDLQTHIIDPLEKESSFGQERYCDVSDTHYLTSFEGGLIMAINLQSGIVDWHTTLSTGTPFGYFFILNNRFYVSTLYSTYVFEGEGGYIQD